MSDEHPDTPRFEPGDYYTAQYGSTPPGTPPADTPPSDTPPSDPPPSSGPVPSAPPPSEPPSSGPQPAFGSPTFGEPPFGATPPAAPGTPPPGNVLAYPPAPPYQPPAAYPAPYPGQPYYPAAQVRGTNSMAIVALIMLFVLPPLAIIFGGVARGQIRRSGEDGDGMALAGLIGGIVLTALYVLGIIVFVLFFVAFADSVTTSINDANLH